MQLHHLRERETGADGKPLDPRFHRGDFTSHSAIANQLRGVIGNRRSYEPKKSPRTATAENKVMTPMGEVILEEKSKSEEAPSDRISQDSKQVSALISPRKKTEPSSKHKKERKKKKSKKKAAKREKEKKEE